MSKKRDFKYGDLVEYTPAFLKMMGHDPALVGRTGDVLAVENGGKTVAVEWLDTHETARIPSRYLKHTADNDNLPDVA